LGYNRPNTGGGTNKAAVFMCVDINIFTAGATRIPPAQRLSGGQ